MFFIYYYHYDHTTAVTEIELWCQLSKLISLAENQGSDYKVWPESLILKQVSKVLMYKNLMVNRYLGKSPHKIGD